MQNEIDEINIEPEAPPDEPPKSVFVSSGESVFLFAASRCPPSEYQVRGLMEVLAHFLDVTEPDSSLIQVNGLPVAGWESRTALLELQKIIGPIHPLTQAAIHALREELRR